MRGCSTLQAVEKRFFRNLNRVLEPAIRAGVGSPWLIPAGAVVMETVGRKSGRVYNIPVLASELNNVLIVSTVRGRSQWIKNVAAKPHINVWLRGKRRPCAAYVVTAGQMDTAGLPAPSATIQHLVKALKPLSQTGCVSFAILVLDAEAENLATGEMAQA